MSARRDATTKPASVVAWFQWATKQRPSLPAAHSTLVAVASFVNNDGTCWPTIDAIAERTPFKHRAVQHHLRALEADGLIRRTLRPRPGQRHRSSTFTLLFTPVTPDTVGAPPCIQVGAPPCTRSTKERKDQEPMTTPPTPPAQQLDFQPVPAPARIRLSGALEIGGAEFDRFWSCYPRRVAKPKAREAWEKAIRKEEAHVIIAAAVAFADDPNRNPQYTPHPTTWLNQERWDDDLTPCPKSNGVAKNEQRQNDIVSALTRAYEKREGRTHEPDRDALRGVGPSPRTLPPRVQ